MDKSRFDTKHEQAGFFFRDKSLILLFFKYRNCSFSISAYVFKISHWWTNRVLRWCLYLENRFPFHYHYPIGSPVRSCLPNIMTRNESFNRNSPFSRCDAPYFGGNFTPVFTSKVTNFTLIGYCKPLCRYFTPELKRIRSVSEKTKQKKKHTDRKPPQPTSMTF